MSIETSTIGRKTIFIFMIKMILTFVSWVGFFFVARYMGSEIWGMIGFALGLVGMFFASDFGFSLAHNKKVSEGKDVGECLGAYIRIKLVLTVILVGALLGGLYIWETVLGHGYQDPMITQVIFVILIYYVIFSITQIPIHTFGGLRQSVKQQLPEFLGTVVRAPVMIFVALTSLSVLALSYSYVLTGLIMLCSSFFLLRRFKIKKPSEGLIKSYVVFAAPVAIYVFFSTISLNLDKVILQLFWDFNEVGVFFMMQKIIMVMILVTGSLGPIFFPSISYYHSRKAFKFVRHLVRRAERYISMILTPIVVLLIPLAVPFIRIMLGNGFVEGADTLAWLSIYALILSLNVPHMHLIIGCGRSDLSAKVGISIVMTNIILLLVLVPRSMFGFRLFGLGSVGAAMALTASVVLGFFLARRYSKQVAKVRTNRRIFRHWVAGALTAFAIFLIMDNLWMVQRWYELIIISGIGLLCYLGLLTLLKEFTKKDLNFFLDLLNPKKMGKYIGGEMKG